MCTIFETALLAVENTVDSASSSDTSYSTGLLCAVLGAATLAFVFMKVKLTHWKRRGILHETPYLVWGNLRGIGKKRHLQHSIRHLYEKYKDHGAPFIGTYAYLKPMVLLLDLNTIQHVLENSQEYFADRGLYNNVRGDPLSENLVQMNGPGCKRLRDRMESVFTETKINEFLPTLCKVATRFETTIDCLLNENEFFDIYDLVDSFNVDVIANLAFGLECDTLSFPNMKFKEMTRKCFQKSSYLMNFFAFQFPKLAFFFNYQCYDSVATEYFCDIVYNVLQRRSMRKPNERPTDFLECFCPHILVAGQPATTKQQKEIAAQSFSFIIAGLEPCNATLVFCLYELAINPELQDLVRLNITQEWKSDEETLKPEELQKMALLKQVLYETLRKYSPYPIILRMTCKDYEVPNSVFVLQAGNHLVIPTCAIHHDPNIYPEPERFSPQRFTPEAISKRHKMAWLPFGAGRRNCIAKYFAEVQMMVCLAKLLKYYRFSPCQKTEIPLQYDKTKLVLTPKRGVILRVQRVT